jgi:HlyD family secretion protein
MFRDTAPQDRPIEPAGGWKRHRRWIIPGVLALVALLFAGRAVLRMSGVDGSVNASRLSFAVVQRGDLVRDVAADGQVVATVSPTLYAPESGTVTLTSHAGDAVTKGQVLATIDSPDLLARLRQEQATLQSAQLDTHRAEMAAKHAQQVAQDAFDQANVDQHTAARELDRNQKAFDLGAIPELTVLKAKDATEKADFALAQARRALAEQPEQNRFDVDSHKAIADRQGLLVADLQRQIDALQLRSPVDGQIGQLQVADRAYVAKDVPVLTVVDLSALEVEIKVPEGLARDLAVGMKAELSGNGGKWQGSVSAVSPQVVAGEVTARVKFDGDKPEGLRQSQRLSVRVLLDRRDNVLTVARGPFVDQDGGYAYVIRDGVAVRTPVRLGATSIDKVEILDGLVEGDRVVISGTENFNGAPRMAISQ